VVTPFTALQNQLLAQCKRAGIECKACQASTDPMLGLYLQAKIIIDAAKHLEQPWLIAHAIGRNTIEADCGGDGGALA
jgi:hypothetical protein